MGIDFNCFKGNENINKIINRNDEISADDSFILKNIFYNKTNFYNEFKYNDNSYYLKYSTYNDNNKNNNIYNNNTYKTNRSNDTNQYKIYNMKDLNRTQLMKIRKLIESFNKNGKPRPSDDFDPKNWTNFYPKNDPFFSNNDDSNIIHNKLVIYNPTNSNKIKIYQGDLNKKGQRHGIGKYTTPFYVLIGMWKNDKFSGWGRESRCDGDVFEGRFINGIMNGKGIFIDINKNKYIGDFINMKRWGKGKWTTNKIKYEGEFYKNKIHGKGHIKFLNTGIEYFGTFKNDQIDGYGTFKWINGDMYEGEVKNGKMNGIGKYKYSNGKIFNGFFNNGVIADKKTLFKTLKEKKEEKLKSIDIFNNEKSYNNINNFIFDDTYIKYNNLLNKGNRSNKIGLYKNISDKNLFKQINYKKNKVKSNSFETAIDTKDHYNINKYEINNFSKYDKYGPIQKIPDYKINNSQKTSEFNNTKNIKNDILNELLIINDNSDNTNDFDYGKNSESYEKKILEELKNMKIEGFENINTDKNDINKDLDYIYDYEKYQIKEFIEHQKKESMENKKQNMMNNGNIIKNESVKETENKEPNPNVLLSTYRNFGFGENNQ